jgi:hypothetical protein
MFRLRLFPNARGKSGIGTVLRIRKHVLLLLGLMCGMLQAADWKDSLTSPQPGVFPELNSFVGDFRFGWSEFAAGEMHVRLDYREGKGMVHAKGGSTGIVRRLWSMDATHEESFQRHGFVPIEDVQIETYSKKKVYTYLVEKSDGMWRFSDTLPQGQYPPRWKRVKVPLAHDMVSAMLFIRSQRLQPGDHVAVVVFPGDASYLVEVDVAKRDQVKAVGKSWNALLLNLHIQKIDFSKSNPEGKLVPHPKFHSGRVWVSDDANRIPLRAEVDLFIGYVYGELVKIHFTEAAPSPSVSAEIGPKTKS